VTATEHTHEPLTRPELIFALKVIMNALAEGEDVLPMLVDLQTMLCRDYAMAEREDDGVALH
jgi:hypothetical protein